MTIYFNKLTPLLVIYQINANFNFFKCVLQSFSLWKEGWWFELPGALKFWPENWLAMRRKKVIANEFFLQPYGEVNGSFRGKKCLNYYVLSQCSRQEAGGLMKNGWTVEILMSGWDLRSSSLNEAIIPGTNNAVDYFLHINTSNKIIYISI